MAPKDQRKTRSLPNAVPAMLAAGAQAGMAGDTKAAIRHFQKAVNLAPALPEAQFNLGTALKRAGKLEDALRHLRNAVRLAPNFVPARINLGTTAQALGRVDECLEHLGRAAELEPKATTFQIIGNAAQEANRLPLAHEALTRSLELDPSNPNTWNELGRLKLKQGDINGALADFRHCLTLRPDYAAGHTNLIQTLCYASTATPMDLLAAGRAFDQACGRPLAPMWRPAAPPNTGRLRIGYCSPDINSHPVGFFWAPLIAAHDRDRFEIFIYNDGQHADHITRATRKAVDHWRESRSLDHIALANAIRADGISILIDLSGHSGAHRLLTLAQRPARLQGIAGGHFSTTGMSAVDFLVSDWHESPAGHEAHFSETLLRLPHGYVCYTPPAYAPAVGPLPALTTGHVTFGIFNRQAKVNPEAIAAWSRILDIMPDSNLLVVGASAHDTRLLDSFRANGIDPARIAVEGHKPHAGLLDAYNRVDIALDTFPYSGGLTTCEALWMGVPVIALAGQRFSSRHSLSHLSNVGLGELAAQSVGDYVALATSLAQDLTRLDALRSSLRKRMAASPLCDVPGTARAFEDGLRALWATLAEGTV